MSRGRLRVISTPYVLRTDEDGTSGSPIQPYRPLLNPCRLCPARCCHTSIKASLPDVIRYCETLEVPIFAGFTVEQTLDERRGFKLDPDPRFHDPDDGWPGWAALRLRRAPGGGCAGLIDVGGYARCGVYDARPMNCRLYPVSWEDEHGGGGPQAVLCPAPFAVTPSVEAQVEADAALARRWWAVHEAAVAQWNQSEPPDRSLERALESLLTGAAAELGRSLPPVVLALGTPGQRLDDALIDRRLVPEHLRAAESARPFAGLPPIGRPD